MPAMPHTPQTPPPRRTIGWPLTIGLSLFAALVAAGTLATMLSLTGVEAETVFPYLYAPVFGLSLWLFHRYMR